MEIQRIRDGLVGDKGRRVPEHVACAVNEYMLEIAKKLGVPEWIIVVNDAPPQDEKSTATMNSTRGSRFAGVWLSDRFLDREHPVMTDFIRTQTLIHEVLHLHFEDVWHFTEDVLSNELGRQASEMGEHLVHRFLEVPIDQLAWALAEILPDFKLPE